MRDALCGVASVVFFASAQQQRCHSFDSAALFY